MALQTNYVLIKYENNNRTVEDKVNAILHDLNYELGESCNVLPMVYNQELKQLIQPLIITKYIQNETK